MFHAFGKICYMVVIRENRVKEITEVFIFMNKGNFLILNDEGVRWEGGSFKGVNMHDPAFVVIDFEFPEGAPFI